MKSRLRNSDAFVYKPTATRPIAQSVARHLCSALMAVLLLSSPAYGQTLRTIKVENDAVDPALSSDGRQIAVSVLGKIWTIPIHGGEGHLIQPGISWDRHPAWSPNGQFLAYAHQLPNGSDLVIYNLATSTADVLYHSEGEIGSIAFDPAGSNLYCVVLKGQYDGHIWRIPTDGGQPKQITETQGWHEWSFALSPDGKRIFLNSGHYGGANLYLLQLDTLAAKRLSNTPWNQSSVAWSKDGRTLAYVETENGQDTIMAKAGEEGPARKVFSSPYDDKQVALAPDGSFAVLSAGRKLYRLDMANGKLQLIPFSASFSSPEASKPDLVITHARLFDGSDGPVIQNATVLIKNGRISSIDKSGATVDLPPDAPVIDASGKTLLPGLMDNHYHYWNAFDGSRLLSKGITAIRDPGSDINFSMEFKQAVATGLLPGPDIYTAGPLIDGLHGYHPYVDVEIDTPAAAKSLVRSLKAQGVDLLKVYFMLKPEVLRAVVAEAHAVGLRVTGHIGVKTGWNEAIDDGIDGVNHIRVWKDFLPLSEQPSGEDESLDASKNMIGRMQANWDHIDLDSTPVHALIEKMAARKIGFDPTLSIQRIDDEMRKTLSFDRFATAQESYRRMSRFVAMASKSGVPLLAGTDDGSLFDEMESYAAAGIPNADILRAATANGAQWLNKSADFGTIQPGRRADLIIVDGDPLKDIKDIRKIQIVVKDGRIVFHK